MFHLRRIGAKFGSSVPLRATHLEVIHINGKPEGGLNNSGLHVFKGLNRLSLAESECNFALRKSKQSGTRKARGSSPHDTSVTPIWERRLRVLI